MQIEYILWLSILIGGPSTALCAEFIHTNKELTFKEVNLYIKEYKRELFIWTLFMLPFLYLIYLKHSY